MELKEMALYMRDGAKYRIISISGDRVYAIDCNGRGMPKWSDLEEWENAEMCEEEIALEADLDSGQLRTARSRYTIISGILPVIADDCNRNEAIRASATTYDVSRRTVTEYLCSYLRVGNIVGLAPKVQTTTRTLNDDEKNIRWALNKYYYSRHGNTLMEAYVMMLSSRYCDEFGQLMEKHPSIHQFRYYYRRHKSARTEIISRKGIKEYQLNYRPLLGNGVREMASTIGYGMLDGTICDIYLVDDAGEIVGRPVLLACVDAYSGICCGYSLLWEGGVYSLRELMLNIITDKVEWCRQHGIVIDRTQWDCDKMPGVLITDRGSEYISGNFSQIAELGVTVTSLASFSANMKGPVEKLFDLIQGSFKPYLRGKGVIEPDFGKRGMHDYRKDACITMETFENIVLRCIIYHNTQRIITLPPDLTDIPPHASDLWEYGLTKPGANLISVGRRELLMTLLPRTTGRFARNGLIVNGMRYKSDLCADRYLQGGTVTVAYNPDDVGEVYLHENGAYHLCELIQREYREKTVDEAKAHRRKQVGHSTEFYEENLQARIDLARQIEALTSDVRPTGDKTISGIRERRRTEKSRKHRNLLMEESDND